MNGCFTLKVTSEMQPPKVQKGTPCLNGVCSDERCLSTDVDEGDFAKVQNPCPGSKDTVTGDIFECNGHGICNSEGNCHCDCGYKTLKKN